MSLWSSVFGGGGSSSKAGSVWKDQAPYLTGLYERAANASQGQGLNQLGGQLTQQGMGYQGNLGQLGQSGGNTMQGQGMLDQLQMQGQVGNPFAQAQIGQLGQGLGRLFNQQILPGINSTFGQSGTFGGDRQALAYGQAAEGLGNTFTSGALDILGNSSQQAIGANAAGLNALQGFGNNAIGANQVGLGGIGSVIGAGNVGMFGALPGLADLLGSPTVLGGSSQQRGPGLFGQFFGGG